MGSGIFKSGNPAERARAIVQAVTHYKDAKLLAQRAFDQALAAAEPARDDGLSQSVHRKFPECRGRMVDPQIGVMCLIHGLRIGERSR